jgi:DNA-binding response OmpR family regulator
MQQSGPFPLGQSMICSLPTHHALVLVENDGLSGAILDHSLGDGDSSMLCARLKERAVPFLIYTGYSGVADACNDAPHGNKPAAPGVLVAAMESLIANSDARQKE